MALRIIEDHPTISADVRENFPANMFQIVFQGSGYLEVSVLALHRVYIYFGSASVKVNVAKA